MSGLFPNAKIKKYINSLTCPLCKCSLEGLPRKYTYLDAGLENIKLSCSQIPFHYFLKLNWSLNELPVTPHREKEELIINSHKFRYQIVKDYSVAGNTSIYCSKINADGQIIDPAETKLMASLSNEAFDLRTYSEAKIISRLKTIIAFQ